jgi:ribosomal protein S18 acetylase RimI-like enzyme
MPRVHDIATIRALLNTDRRWSLYALGDLAPEHFPHTAWYRPADDARAILMLYRAFKPTVVFGVGPPEQLAPLLDEIDEPALSLHVPPQMLPLLRRRHDLVGDHAMWRMVLDADAFPHFDPECERLTLDDVPALERLFDDGDVAGERPHYFFPAMVESGVFCGIREGNAIVAVAGTHLVVPAEGIAAVGNIYTRRDARRRGLARRTTAAVAAELVRCNIETIGLNVAQTNVTAARVYEALGFRRYCEFYEGDAVRRPEEK